jgi:hypothetical protein
MVKGIVMDIRDGKRAVVLDADGRFRVIANEGFRIGQSVDVHRISRFVRPSNYKKAQVTLVCAGAAAIIMSVGAIIHLSVKQK